MLHSRPHPAGIEHAAADRSFRAHAWSAPPAPAARAQKHRLRRAPRRARGSASRARPLSATIERTRRSMRIVGRRQGRPDQATGPIVEHLCLGAFDQRAADFGATRGRRRNAPDIARACRPCGRERRHIADRAARTSATELPRACRGGHRAPPALPARLGDAPRRERRPRAERPSPPPRRGRSLGHALGERRRQVRGRGRIGKGAHDRRHELAGCRVVEAEDKNRFARFRPGAAS